MTRSQLRHGLRALIGERREGASYDFTTLSHFGCGADLRRGIEFGGGVVPSSGKGARVRKNTLVTAFICDQLGAVRSGLGVQPKSKVIFNKDAALATEAFPSHPIAGATKFVTEILLRLRLRKLLKRVEAARRQ